MFSQLLRATEVPLVIDLGESDDDELIAAVPPTKRRRKAEPQVVAATRAAPGESDEAFARRLQQEEDANRPGPRVQREQERLGRAQQGQLASAPWARRACESVFPGMWPFGFTSGTYGGIERVPALASDLVRSVAPLFDVCGTAHEPLIFVRDVDGRRGRLLAGGVLDELWRRGLKPPTPARGRRGAITVEWHRNKRSRTPWNTGVQALADLADQLLAYLRADATALQRVPALGTHRGWNDTEVLVSTPGCHLGRHTDAQPEGSLLFIFCAGLSCRSVAWPGGQHSERVLESGDVMIMDGKRTAHAVPKVLEHTSPVPQCPWLGQRRLSALVRQRPPGG